MADPEVKIQLRPRDEDMVLADVFCPGCNEFHEMAAIMRPYGDDPRILLREPVSTDAVSLIIITYNTWIEKLRAKAKEVADNAFNP